MPLAEGLDALLRAIPQIDEVEITRSLEDVLQKIGGKNVGLVVLDAVLCGDETQALLEKIASTSPHTKRVLLVDSVQEMKWMPHYAEAILIKGVSPVAFATIVSNLLISKGDTDEHIDSGE